MRKSALASILFFAALWLPLLSAPLWWNYSTTLFENSTQAVERFEQASFFQKPTAFNALYERAFGGRGMLIKVVNTVRYALFGVTATDLVIIGKDRWLFIGGEDGKRLDIRRGKYLFSDSKLRSFKRGLEAEQHLVEHFGGKFLYVIAPDKEAIYPELYPQYLPHVEPEDRYQQLADYLKENSTVPVLYLRDALLRAKAKESVPLYFKYDAHWNDLGGFYGYSEIAQKLKEWFPQVVPLDLSRFQRATRNGNVEFVRVMGLLYSLQAPSVYLDDPQPDPWMDRMWTQSVNGAHGENAMRAEEAGKHKADERVERGIVINGKNDISPDKLPKLVMYRDSFATRMTKYLTKHFDESVILSHADYKFNPDFIEQEKPTVVIDEYVERNVVALSDGLVDRINQKIEGPP